MLCTDCEYGDKHGLCKWHDNNYGPRPCRPKEKYFFHFFNDQEEKTVYYSMDGLIEGLRYMSNHTNARAEPEFFEAAAHRLAEIATEFEKLQRVMR